MQIVVCVKQILDPELPARDFRLDPQTQLPVLAGARLVLDSYAENALEAAIQLRDAVPGSKVTALCVGDKAGDEGLRRALSFTADAAVRVWDPSWWQQDGPAVAHALARAIRFLGGADLVLTGRQAGDIEEGLVGPMLAEELSLICVTLVTQLTATAGRLQAVREADGGRERVSVSLPAVVTVSSSESNVPRLPKARDQMLARGKPIRLLGPAEIGADPQRLMPGVHLVRTYVPEAAVQCELLAGADGPAQAKALTERLGALKLL